MSSNQHCLTTNEGQPFATFPRFLCQPALSTFLNFRLMILNVALGNMELELRTWETTWRADRVSMKLYL